MNNPALHDTSRTEKIPADFDFFRVGLPPMFLDMAN